ncbi:dihydrodipicolinate synthase family protein [candidate division KSB3 bacterium]|uniref:Dihydrodipicolinate synthase family protein n=1 Tax=candidate division KSB3 bacterium TaxID=2044937 RepID=A0A9D5JV25_9BACT|nr:dihydrodipicolinate synthase family protein [candidate division KSB3 bacterium]MBD3324457.1 dihydrodipicolinate synthase family protein [candidate division KSB3 bacterium]
MSEPSWNAYQFFNQGVKQSAMNVESLQGVIPPIVTPFDANEEVDLEIVRREVKYLLSTGIDGISAGGSTGEGALLSDAELQAILEVVVAENSRGVPVIGGVIRNSTRDAIKTAQMMQATGADALLVTPVFYHGATAEGNYVYYNTIAEAVGLPLIVYNVVPTNPISAPLMLRLSEIEGVVGIKQVDPQGLMDLIITCGDRTKIFSACDAMLYSTYVAGACGTIAAIVTVAPELCVQQWQAFQDGDQTTGQAIQQKLAYLVKAYADKPFPGKVKELLNQQGRPVGNARSPVLEPTPEEKASIRESLQRAGLLAH